jgi:hypothetical protein
VTGEPHADPDQAYFESPDFDPTRFMASLVYFDDVPSDVTVPAPLTDDDVVLVRRTYQLPYDVDAGLQAAAAAQHITVEELLQRWTHDHDAA